MTTEDGVQIEMLHLKNPGKPIILLEPGMGAQGLSLEKPALALRLRGDFDVFIGNWRGSVVLPAGMRSLGVRNGLVEIARNDVPAQLRHIIYNYASGEQLGLGITLFGHSMGGMMISALLSDPGLAREFRPRINAVLLFQSPHHVRYIQRRLKLLARLSLPFLRALKASGVSVLENRDIAKNSAVESVVMALVRLIMNPEYTGPENFRNIFFETGARRIPLDLVLDFARAAAGDGEFRNRAGDRILHPTQITGLPVQIVRGRLDSLAVWEEQGEYFEALNTSEKQLVSVPHIHHMDSVLLNGEEFAFFDNVLAFTADPVAEIERRARVAVPAPCGNLL